MWVSERVWLILGEFSSAKNSEELPRWCVKISLNLLILTSVLGSDQLG